MSETKTKLFFYSEWRISLCELIIEKRLSDSTDINHIMIYKILLYTKKYICLVLKYITNFLKSHFDKIELGTRHLKLNCLSMFPEWIFGMEKY